MSVNSDLELEGVVTIQNAGSLFMDLFVEAQQPHHEPGRLPWTVATFF